MPCMITIIYYDNPRLKLALITESYSRFVGYTDRKEFLEDAGLLHCIDKEVYHDPATRQLYMLDQLAGLN